MLTLRLGTLTHDCGDNPNLIQTLVCRRLGGSADVVFAPHFGAFIGGEALRPLLSFAPPISFRPV